MNRSHNERLRLFSELIRKENDRKLNALFASLTAKPSEKTSDSDISKQTHREKVVLLTLHALKCQEHLSLYESGECKCIDEFCEDWKEVLDCVKYLSGNWDIMSEVVSVSADLVLLINPSNRNVFLRMIGRNYAKKVHDLFPLNAETFFSACEMIEYCLELDLVEDAVFITRNLTALSKLRNTAAVGKHREVVVQALLYLVDINAPEAVRIGKENDRYFNGVSDEIAARFYWLLGYVLTKIGDETSGSFFEKCCSIYTNLEGERSWSAAKAAIMYNYSLIDTNQNDTASRFLWQFLSRIDEGYYINTDETMEFFAAYTRYVLLTRTMEHGSLRGLLPEINRLYEYCKLYKENNANPRLTIRAVENIYSGYYMEMGDHLIAAQHSRNALDAIPPNGLERIPSDDLIVSNLLNIYSQINDVDKMEELIHHLKERSEQFRENRNEYYRIALLIKTAEQKIGASVEDHIDDSKESLAAFYLGKENHTRKLRAARETDTAYALWLLGNMSEVLDTFSASRSELRQYYEIVEHLLANPDVYISKNVQNASAYMVKTQILWELNDSRAISSATECLAYSKDLAPTQEALVSVKQKVAVILNSFGCTDLAKQLALETLESITASWHKAVSYLNDHRVCQVMANIQSFFEICYAILKQTRDVTEQYGQILRFKNLPALIGRERNRLLQTTPIDETLKARIFKLQDKLASAQIDDAVGNSNSSGAIIDELQRLEAQFAAAFPQNLIFTDISVKGVFDCLGNQDVVVEYFFSYNKKALSGKPFDSDHLELEIYIIFKEGQNNRILRLTNSDGDSIIRSASELVSYFQERGTDDIQKAATIRNYMYQCLIAPVLPYIKNTRHVFLAPDLVLCNLPIETLAGPDGVSLSDCKQVSRLVCGRDLLFFHDSEIKDKSSFVLGNPDYNADQRNETSIGRNFGNDGLACPLPFAELEALSVSKICNCMPITGKAATKYALQKSLPCRIIHISTHGEADETMASDSLFTSVLLFAGYNKWLSSGIEDDTYGNGILTADEISRMDLSKTELVVLSACKSGLGDISFGSVQGLISAFSAAGAKWIICHLWPADDYATAILMEAFYHAYIDQKLAVPDALQAAKQYLRGVTVRQLRVSGWLDLPKNLYFPQTVKDDINTLRRAIDRRKPFNGDYYWGGFVCYRSR